MTYILIFVASIYQAGSVSFQEFQTKEICEQAGKEAAILVSNGVSSGRFKCIEIKDKYERLRIN